MSDAKLAITGIAKTFNSRGNKTRVFESLSLEIHANEFVSFLGPTGCGKTTLLNLIAGFLLPDAGDIQLNGKRIDGPDRTRAVIFQDDAVFPWFTTAGNIEYGLRMQGAELKARQDEVTRLLGEFGLLNERNKYPRELSGGQRKRVDLARALANTPELLLMDEPFSSLDPATKETLCSYVSDVLQKRRTTTLLVTHDIEEAIWMSDRIIVLSLSPAKLKHEQPINFKRPRTPELRFSSEFQELRKSLANQLRT